MTGTGWRVLLIAASVSAACGGSPEVDIGGVWTDYVETAHSPLGVEIECTRVGRMDISQDGARFHGTLAGTRTCVAGSDTASVTGQWDLTEGAVGPPTELLTRFSPLFFRLEDCGYAGQISGAAPANRIQGNAGCDVEVSVGGVDSALMQIHFTAAR